MNTVTKPPGYLGHRRENASARRRWIWVVTALVTLCVVIAVSVAMRSSSPDDRSAGGGEPDVIPSGPATAGTPSSSAGADPSQNASPSPSHSSARPPFQPIVLEAESGSAELGGPAQIVPYTGASGGSIVQNLGRLGPGAKKTGTLTFPDVTVPNDGTYTLTLYLVTNDSRTAVVSVAGGSPIKITVAGGAKCCSRSVVTINLKKGRNSVTFGNPDDRAPSVDRIMISAP
ncbi:hypothetical protein ABZS66_22905 [Dactylosporangium sp. NPDC005572]|uniref:hypothetical protein n=1 Tax=Dactylosporangium sp. NPDC005572 TaxID=3156889 RepID=UPI0033AD4238